MRWAFRRRRGRHALGAAVTSIPSVPVRPTAPSNDRRVEPAPPTSYDAVVEPVPPPSYDAVVAVPEPNVTPVVGAASLPVAGPRVELVFRDGSHAALDPSSDQARALDDLAQVLQRRD